MGFLRPWHIAVVVVVLILLFGAKRLPDAARSLGRSLRIIKAETKGLAEDDVQAKADAQAGYQVLPPNTAPQQQVPPPAAQPQPQPAQPGQPVPPPAHRPTDAT